MILSRRVCLSTAIAIVLFLALASSLSIHAGAQGPTSSSPSLDIILLLDFGSEME